MFDEPTIESLTKQVKDLTSTVKNLEDVIRRIEKAPALDRNLDNTSKDILGQEIGKKIIDIVWNQYFYYFSAFESAEGWDVTSDAAVDVDSGGLDLLTTAVADNRANAVKSLPFVADFDNDSRFRTVFYLSVDTTASDIDYSMSVGSGIEFPRSASYGFRVEENVLYGIARDDSFETKIPLMTLEELQGNGLEAYTYIVEARFYAGNRVEYYVSEVNQTKPLLRGTITTTLPSGSGVSIAFDLYTRTTTAKQAYVYFVEYIQNRPIN